MIIFMTRSIEFSSAVCNDRATNTEAIPVAAAFFIDMYKC